MKPSIAWDIHILVRTWENNSNSLDNIVAIFPDSDLTNMYACAQSMLCYWKVRLGSYQERQELSSLDRREVGQEYIPNHQLSCASLSLLLVDELRKLVQVLDVDSSNTFKISILIYVWNYSTSLPPLTGHIVVVVTWKSHAGQLIQVHYPTIGMNCTEAAPSD
jgi:hypothetical protein